MFSKRRFRRNKPRTQSLLENGEQQKENLFIPPVQTKLNVGKPGDVYEVEADKTADEVVNRTTSPDAIQKVGAEEEEVQAKPLSQGLTPFVQKQEAQEEEPVQAMKEEEEPVQKQEAEEEERVQAKEEEEESIQAQEEEEAVQAKCNDCGEEDKVQKMDTEKEDTLQTKSDGQINVGNSIETRLSNAKGGGNPMNKSIKTEMEQAFGTDFSKVRIHTDIQARGMSQKLNAQAFTHGNDIYFNSGKYDPNSKNGKRLLAHELTHTIQQGFNKTTVQKKVNSEQDTSKFEVEHSINNLELSIGIAEKKLLDNTLDRTRRAKIEHLYSLLRNVLLELYKARGTDGAGVILDFDTDPHQYEINPGDSSKSISELYYPFSVSQSANRDGGGSGVSEPSLQAKPVEHIGGLGHPMVQRFCDPLICVGIIVLGGILLSGCSTSSSGAIGPARLRSAKANFDSNNTGLSAAERTRIHTAMSTVVGPNTNLLISFYDYYSNMGIHKKPALTGTGTYAETRPRSDTHVDPAILTSSFSSTTLGTLLIHEYTHTRHLTNVMGMSDFQEGDSYGIEYFFAERSGDTTRMSAIAAITSNPTTILSSFQVPAFRANLCKSYGTLKVLYEIIETGGTSHSSSTILSGLTGNGARELATEMVAKKESDHSSDLTAVISWVRSNHSAIGIIFRCS